MPVNTNNNIIAFHPYAKCFPLMLGAELDEFVDDIGKNGLREPITLYQDKILDGQNRHRARLGPKIEPRFEKFKGDDAAAIACRFGKKICRRQLKPRDKRERLA